MSISSELPSLLFMFLFPNLDELMKKDGLLPYKKPHDQSIGDYRYQSETTYKPYTKHIAYFFFFFYSRETLQGNPLVFRRIQVNQCEI